jgi:hypothetical protein
LSVSVGHFSLKTVLDGNFTRTETQPYTYGASAAQDISYIFQKIPLKIDIGCRFFDAQHYDNRIYGYEKDVLYAFSFPMFYGIGSRYYINLNYKLTESWVIYFKLAQIAYSDDRKTISSGNEQIEGNRKTDARILVRWRF